MIKKIRFMIIEATSEAEGHGVKNLEHQHPSSPGWQTQKFCSYPQEVVFHLCESCRMKKFQILSHQYMISSKVEFFVATDEAPDQFARLGYVHLANNEANNFKSRELKSVHVDAEGQYLKLLFHRNHNNKLNIYHQVGVVAFNILGEPSNRPNTPLSVLNMSNSHANKSTERTVARDTVSPLDDLLFDMYMDAQVLSIIRILDERKKKAIVEEDYDTAKRMKVAIVDLHQIGEKLTRYEMEKQHAVENEDYDLAKSLKFQIDEYRLKIHQQLQKHNLMEDLGIFAKEGLSSILSTQRSDTEKLTQKSSPLKVNSHTSPLNVQDSFPAVAFEASGNVYVEGSSQYIPHDEKIIPTHDKYKLPDPFLAELSSSSLDGTDEGGGPVPTEPEPLSEDQLHDAKSLIEVFGIPLVTEAYSKTWSFRAKALTGATQLLLSSTDSLSKEQIRNFLHASTTLVSRLLKDHVYAVHRTALKLLETILVDFIPRHKLSKVDITHVVAHTFPTLVQKTGETAPRGRASAVEFIVRMSDFESVRSVKLVSHRLLSPIKRETSHRQALSRVEMVKQLLSKHGFSDSSLGLDSVMKFSLAALEHTSGPVREEASKVIHETYKLVGSPVRAYFSSDEQEIRKNTLAKQLIDGFDEIDRKLQSRQSQRKMKDKDPEKKKKEMDELQNQLDKLQSQGRSPSDTDRRKRGRPAARSQNMRPEKVFVTPHPKPSAKYETLVYQELSDSSGDEADVTLERTCIFCGERDDSFTEDGLDFHYWKHCPMLKRCLHCKQVVEICNFSEHLLTECDGKDKFKFCPRCSEAVLKVDFERHVTSKKCAVLQPNIEEHCPLCHENIPQGDESWQRHLMGSRKDACSENPRRLPTLKRFKAKLNNRHSRTRVTTPQ